MANWHPWQEYKKRRNCVIFALVGYLPVVAGFEFIVHLRRFLPVIVFLWAGFFLVTVIRLQTWRCPSTSKSGVSACTLIEHGKP